MIDSRAEKIGDRPVLEHEEDVVVSSLAKTSLRGPLEISADDGEVVCS